MKYFVAYSVDRDLTSQMRPEALTQAIGDNQKFWARLQKEDKVEEWGYLGSHENLFAVVEVKSHGELYRIIEQAPISAFSLREVTPVVTGSEFADVYPSIEDDIENNMELLNPEFTGKRRRKSA